MWDFWPLLEMTNILGGFNVFKYGQAKHKNLRKSCREISNVNNYYHENTLDDVNSNWYQIFNFTQAPTHQTNEAGRHDHYSLWQEVSQVGKALLLLSLIACKGITVAGFQQVKTVIPAAIHKQNKPINTAQRSVLPITHRNWLNYFSSFPIWIPLDKLFKAFTHHCHHLFG